MPAHEVTSPAATDGRDARAGIDRALPHVPSQPLPIIVNAAAGAGRAKEGLESLEEVFRTAGLDARLVPFGRGDDLRSIAAEAAADRPAAVVAAGGDGTINAVASALVGTDIPLGVLPLGTLNHFAKDLRIPVDPVEAANTIAAGHIAEVDVGYVNGLAFLNNSSLGLYPSIVRHRESQQRRLGRGKWPALLWATWTVLRRRPFLKVRLCLDDVQSECITSFVFIGNNDYTMEGFNIGVRERLDQGRLSIYMSQRRSRARLLMLAFRALFGRLYQAKDFEALTAQSVTVETRHRRLHVATDGEVNVLDTPLEYTVRPRALRVLVPAPPAAQT
jgi:diacylglycerol kinase family enzyme